MKYMTREGEIVCGNDSQDAFLRKLYTTGYGRLLVRIMVRPFVSNIGGWILSTPFSTRFIEPFIRKNDIDMSSYEETEYSSYNDFFTRSVKEGERTFDMEKTHLVSPCDGKATYLPIRKNGLIRIKEQYYTVESLLRDKKLAKKYYDGTALILRLTVDDYHRYFYFDDGRKSHNRNLEGIYHTVNPIANDEYPIYRENHRQYCMIRTENFGDVIMMEVGALMVGKIVNNHEKASVKRGMEKGHFEFGGSTIVLMLEKGAAVIDEDIMNNSCNGIETIVKAGEKIGEKSSK